jgi:hypothetical protein
MLEVGWPKLFGESAGLGKVDRRRRWVLALYAADVGFLSAL